ncbi:DUF4293 domain-containing protein [Flavobacteriaceae bacterium]|jgi:uncharacterized protein involved in response to NO|nr:DUF4293 domain-containing protein [Flavobacteriaceae bacterium]
MIQRIQTLYLLIVFLMTTVLLYYSHQWEQASSMFDYKVFLLSPILTLLTIVLFKKRTFQVILSVLLIAIQLIIVAYYVYYLMEETRFELSYFAVVISLVSICLLFLARRAILKDEALVRSVDRIR